MSTFEFMAKFSSQQETLENAQSSALISTNAPDALGVFLKRFNTMAESYFFYKNSAQPVELRFDEASWVYFLVDPSTGALTPQNGITSMVRIIDKSNALIPWASKKVVEKMLSLVSVSDSKDEFGSYLLAPMTLEEFTALCMKAKTAPKDILEDAGNLGKQAHTWLEFYVKAVLAGNLSEQTKMLLNKCEDARATNCVEHALAWITAHNVRYTETERKVYSREYCYAGTLDGLALVDSCSDTACCTAPFKDRLSLIDYKTSNHLHDTYLLQTAAYCKAYMEEHGVVIEDRWVLRLGKEEADFEAWHQTNESYEEDLRAFLACIVLSNLVDSISERMKGKRKHLRGVKKQQRAEEKEIAKMKAKVEKAAAKAQLKLDRVAEKERIKRDAKVARELAKHMHQSRLLVLSEETKNAERPEPVNEVPGETKDTTASTVAPEDPQSHPSVLLPDLQLHSNEEVPIEAPAKVVAEEYEEGSIERKPFAVPEEEG